MANWRGRYLLHLYWKQGRHLARRAMTGEEVAGPAGPKVARFLYFVGAGFICTIAINKWRELEKKTMKQKQQQQQQQQIKGMAKNSSDAVALHK